MKTLRTAIDFVDRRPLLAIVLGMLAAFAIEYFAASHFDARADQPAIHHSRGTV